MTAVLGVDGGQSAIRLRHSAAETVVEVDGVGRLEGDSVAAVANAVAVAWRRGEFEPIDRVMLGLTTAPVDAIESDRLCALVAASTDASEVWLADDSVTSHAGALSGGPGVSLVAGTGVACLAVPATGDARTFGGHGSLFGDEGGAFWIGRAGLSAVLRARDGRGAGTSLSTLAARRFGDLVRLHVRLHEAARPVNTIAQFAPDVFDAAEGGDTIACAIVDQAAQELLLVARAGASWVGGPAVPLALGGRLLAPNTVLRRRLDALLEQREPEVAPRSADASALDGAIRLGLASGRERQRYGRLIHTWRVPAG